MKTTIDLPDDLVHDIQSRAARQGRQAGDVMAELLRQGLIASAAPEPLAKRARITIDPATGLPLIKCRRRPSKAEIAPDRIADILAAQELDRYAEASR